MEWIEGLPLPAGEVYGTLGTRIVPYLQSLNVPVSLVASDEDPLVRIAFAQPATVLDALTQISGQAPTFRIGAVDGRLVIYPKEHGFDRMVDLGDVRTVTRSQAYFLVLRALRAKCPLLQNLDITFSGHWLGSGKMPFADQVEVGGSRSVIEHLISLLDRRPSAVLLLRPAHGKLAVTYQWVQLIESIELRLPATAVVGESLTPAVTGILRDRTKVSLADADCEVSYATSDPAVLEIDRHGRVSTRKRGAADISVEYEHRSATAHVVVN